MTTVSVVIATYTEKRWGQLVDSIKSAQSQEPAPSEIIVVVDHNPDLLKRAESELKGVSVIRNSEKQGLSGARNSGARAAKGSIVAFLDDDARARSGWLAALLAGLDDPTVAGVGGWPVPEWEKGSGPRWLPEEFLWIVGCHYRGLREDRGPIRSPIGATMAFRRSAVRSVGGFSHQFSDGPFDCCEETEFAIRVRRNGLGEIVFVPNAIIDHSVSADRHQWSYFVRRCLREGRAKAALWSVVGGDQATSIERTYVARTLVSGLGRYVRRGLRGNVWEFIKGANLIVGLTAAAAGFLKGQVLLKLQPMAAATPIPWPVEVESREDPAFSDESAGWKGLG